MQAMDIITLIKLMQIHNNSLIYAGLSTLSLPFVIYISFKIGNIVYQFKDLNKRVTDLERIIKHLLIGKKKD